MLVCRAQRLAPHTTELVIKRSRFLTEACHVASLQDGRDFVAEVRARYPLATHHCWACVGGEAGDEGQAACSDDGEPKGTAGKPMLQVLLHSGLGELCLVVTRWFGGIKLGTGGLVRAYQDSVRLNLESLPVCEKRVLLTCSLLLSYDRLDAVSRVLLAHDSSIERAEYGEKVTLTVSVPKEALCAIKQLVSDLTGGQSALLVTSGLA